MMQNNKVLIIFLILLISVYGNLNRFRNSIKNKHQAKFSSKNQSILKKLNLSTSQACNLEWPLGLTEQIRQNNENNACELTVDKSSGKVNCNDWDKIRKIANCKAAKFKDSLTDKDDFFYVQTDKRTQQEGDWAKFTYVEIKDAKTEISGSAFVYRICVPVSRKYNSWIDNLCPSDPCGPIELQSMQKGCGLIKTDTNAKKLEDRRLRKRFFRRR